MSFEERIKKYPAIYKTYEDAIETGEGLKGSTLECYVSKHCRAYFFQHHLKVEREPSDQEIRDINKSPIVPFELSDVQMMLLEKFEARMAKGVKFHQRIMKCRRAQVSTLFLAIGYHIARFNPNKKGLVFADRLETSRKLRRILEVFYQGDDLPDRPEIGKKTLSEGLYLHPPGVEKGITDRDSFILLGSAEQKNTGVSGSLDFFHWSESALSPDAETHWTTISPSLKGALFTVAESTPSLIGQDSTIYPSFEKPTDDCDAVFLSWMDIKDYTLNDPEKEKEFVPNLDHSLYGKEIEIMDKHSPSIPQMLWRRFKLDELKNLSAFRQVFPISPEEAFYASAGLFFHKDLIASTKPKVSKDGKMHIFSDQGISVSAMVDATGMWRLYDGRNLDASYMITTDIAEGKCADKEMRDPDYSVAIIWRLGSPVEEVGFLRERIPPEILGEQVAVAARYFNDALVVPERNGPGLAFLVRLRQLYSNIYKQQRYQHGSFVLTDEYGFQTTSTTKVHALSTLLSQIRDKGKGLILHTETIRNEMAKFASQGVKIGAMSGYHDDTITNLWLMSVCLSQTPNLLMPRDLDGQGGYEGGNLWSPKIERENSWQYR